MPRTEHNGALFLLFLIALAGQPQIASATPFYLCEGADGRKELVDKARPNCKVLDLPDEIPTPNGEGPDGKRKVPPKRKAPTGDRAIAYAKDQVLERMTDPDTTRFRRIKFNSDSSLVCGQFNSKNLMGGYVGYQWFTVRVRGSASERLGHTELDVNRCG